MGTHAADGIRNVTLGAWIEFVDTRGWAEERVWSMVRDAAIAALPAVGRRLRRGEDEEVVSEVVALARTVPDSWTRPERRHVPLVRWIAGVMKRVVRSMRRRELPGEGGDQLAQAAAPEPEERAHADEPPELPDPAALLTEYQFAAWQAHCRGLSARAAADELGISRDAYRDRLRRAIDHLRSGVPAPARRDAHEIAQLAAVAARSGRPQEATLLILWRGAGKTYKRCAELLRTTVESVRSRLGRLWRMWRPSLAEAVRDTDLPPRTLDSMETLSASPGRGATDGVPHEALAAGGLVRPGAPDRARAPGGRSRPPERGG